MGDTFEENSQPQAEPEQPKRAASFPVIGLGAESGEQQAGEAEPVMRLLEEELQRSKEQHQAAIEQYETQTEELKASNEEMLAMNEELRSATEELETGKEELQSVNEEIQTINGELKQKLDEIAVANSDLQNLITSTDLATVFVDSSLNIRFFTPRAQDIFSLIPSDTGRSLSDITHKLDYADMLQDVERVLDDAHKIDREVMSCDGRWYIAQVTPYHTAANSIEGVILTFIDFTARKLAEGSLLEAKERLSLLVESTKDHAIYTMDADGRIDYWNTGAQALFGYTESEIIGKSTALLFTPGDRERQELERVMREADERGSVEDERWYVRKDGTRFYASGVLSRLRDERVEAGTVHGYAMIARDLTESKTAADESTRFQAHLLNTVEQSVIATDLDGIVIYWNQFAQKLFGWTAQEAIGRQIMELTTPEVMAEQALEIMSQLRQGESWTGEFNVQRRDGTTFPVQIINSPINDDKGTLIGIVGVSVDISERKRQENSLIELARQLERQSNVFNTTLSAIIDFAYIFDRDGRFIYANQPLLDLWGLKLDEAVGKNFSDLQYPDDLALRLQQQIRQVFDTGQALRDDTPYTSPTGAQGFYEYIFTPVKASDGTVEVVAGSTRDYTERKRVEIALRESRERLQMAMNAAKIYSWEMNLATEQVEWSNNLERVIGFHLPSDFATVNKFIHPEDRKETVKLIAQATSGGEDYESEFRLVNPKSGEIVWLRGQGVLVGNAQNSPQRFVGITQNITERKHTEILLDTQKQALEMVVGGSPLAEVLEYLTGIVEHQSSGSSIASIMLLDEQGRLHTGASPSLPEDYVQAIEGIKADESVGTCSAAAATCKTIITPDIAADPKWQDFKHLPLGLGLQAAWSLPIVAADNRVLGTFGTYFREKREPTKLERQTVEFLAKTAALAIERKRAEEELNASEERLRTIFEASRDGILVEDDEHIVYVNQSYTHLLGYEDPEELIGRHVSYVISPEDTERLLEFGKSRVRGKLHASVYEFKGKRKDGTLIEVEASVSASNVTGHSYITSIVRDITERKRAEAELKQINEQLEGRVTERTAALSEMNAILQEEVRERRRIEGERVDLLRRIVFAQEDERRRIAREMHDQFGQQLTVLKLKLDAVKEDCGENANLCGQLEALQMIAGQLDADVDHMIWEMRPTALDDLGLQAALSSYIRNWSKHFGVPVQLHTSGMDKDRLKPEIETTLYRIAQEALNNVAKYAEARSVAVMLERRAGQVSLIIEDDGVGFDLQQVLGADDKGLGIIGMRERAALVGGTVEIESHPDEGATVVVRIPTPPVPQTGDTDE